MLRLRLTERTSLSVQECKRKQKFAPLLPCTSNFKLFPLCTIHVSCLFIKVRKKSTVYNNFRTTWGFRHLWNMSSMNKRGCLYMPGNASVPWNLLKNNQSSLFLFQSKLSSIKEWYPAESSYPTLKFIYI